MKLLKVVEIAMKKRLKRIIEKKLKKKLNKMIKYFLNAHTIKSQKTQQNDSKKVKCLMMKLLMHTYHF